MIAARDMVRYADAYRHFALELAETPVFQPWTIPCAPQGTGIYVSVPPGAPSPREIRPITGYEEAPPAGSRALEVFEDRAGRKFIYLDHPDAEVYLPKEPKRYYFRRWAMPRVGLPPAGSGGHTGGTGSVPRGRGETTVAQDISQQIEGPSAPSRGKRLTVQSFRQQFAGGGGQTTVSHVAPNSKSGNPPPPESTVRFKVVFEFESAGAVLPFHQPDKSVMIRDSGGKPAWGRPFFLSLLGDPPKVTEIESPLLWNDQTFEFEIEAGVRFAPRVPGDPVKEFFIRPVEIDLPRTGRIQLTVRAELLKEVQIVTAATKQAAFDIAKQRLIARHGISWGMLESVRFPTPTPGPTQFNVAIKFFTGRLDVTDIRKLKRAAARP